MRGDRPRGALDRARELRRNRTEAEAHLWSRLRRRQLGGQKFRRQVPIGRYIVDFACPAACLVVEVDGCQHDLATEADASRDAWLTERGYRVLRFWNNQVLAETEAVLEDILRALGEANTEDKNGPPGT
jgi:very-short-patch-repair endonuclease